MQTQHAAGELYLENESKAQQRTDDIDRSKPFSRALRNHKIAATDLDFIVTDGHDKVRLVIEVTCPDETVFSPQAYLQSIDERRRRRTRGNHNDQLITELAALLRARAILVVFTPDIEHNDDSIVWWRYVNGVDWHETTARDFFARVARTAYG